jgi:hypothetical protein
MSKVSNLEMHERALKYLQNNNMGSSEEIKILKNSIKSQLLDVKRNFGDILKDKVEDFK